MLKIRRPLGRLIFNMGIAIPGKTVFLIETAPWLFSNVVQCCALRNLHHCPTHSQYLLVCGSIIYDSVPRKVKTLNKIWIPTTWYCHWRRSHLTFYLACCNMVIKKLVEIEYLHAGTACIIKAHTTAFILCAWASTLGRFLTYKTVAACYYYIAQFPCSNVMVS